MSDRGYIALSIELEAKAIEAEIAGMNAANACAYCDKHYPPYKQNHFTEKANALRQLSEKVRGLIT